MVLLPVLLIVTLNWMLYPDNVGNTKSAWMNSI